MNNKISMSDLDDFYIKGEISENEYLHLAMEDVNILAIATDKNDDKTTVSLIKSGGSYFGEVLYAELSKKDEKFLTKEASLDNACDKFLKRVVALENSSKHEFEILWYLHR